MRKFFSGVKIRSDMQDWYSSEDSKNSDYDAESDSNSNHPEEPILERPSDRDPEEIPPRANYGLCASTTKCHYNVVLEVLKNDYELHLTRKGAKKCWDLLWSDGPIPEEVFSAMKPWQRCNHVPGIYNLARKNMLARHLVRM